MAPTTQRGSWWSLTINNPTPDDRKRLQKEGLPAFVKMVQFQDEIGKEGTPHIQGAAHTAQVRFSAIKEWLPRAHIELARNKESLLNYVWKSETAIPGTQMKSENEFITMEKAMLMIAEHKWDYCEWAELHGHRIDPSKHASQEYWRAVKYILLEKPSLIGLFSNPQFERAWVNTRSVWLTLKDRQTDRQGSEDVDEINSPDKV